MTAPILTFVPAVNVPDDAPDWLREAFTQIQYKMTLVHQKLGNHTQAMGLLNAKIPAASNVSTTTIIEGGSSVTPVPPPTQTVGAVNDQSGVTTYATQSGDYGALVILNDASAIAVSLPPQTPPWFCFIANQGTGTATLTPITGTISYASNSGASSMPIAGGYSAIVAFDGTDWWGSVEPTAEIIALLAPLDSPAFTGTPTAPTASPGTNDTQLATTAYADAAVAVETTRAETAEALLAPIASPTFTGTVTQPDAPVLSSPTTATSATAGAATALPATPAGYLQISLGGTDFKIPYFAV